MSDEERQAALDNIPLEELEKIHAKTSGGIRVEIEDLLLIEFALKFGWEAYKDARDDLLEPGEMMRLLAGSRKLDYLSMYRDALASFTGSGSARAKKPSQTFNSITKSLITKSEADS